MSGRLGAPLTAGPLVLVTWVDSRQPSAGWAWWKPLKDTWRVPVIRTAGFILHNDEEQLVLASSLSDADEDGDHQYLGAILIPRCCVRICETLRDAP
jgi:hypothetical protein